VNADCQSCINFYPEADESGLGKSPFMLYPTPGLSLFARVANGQQVRGQLTIDQRTFAVVDAELLEILGNGTTVPLGAVANDSSPVSMVASPFQLLVASTGILYVYQFKAQPALGYAAGTFTANIATNQGPFPNPQVQVGYIDGFFIVLITQSEQFFVSNSLDATQWDAAQTKIISTFPDNVVSMVCDHRQIAFLGQKSSEFEYDSGNLFPFDTVPGGFMEEGCGAQFASVQLDNSIFWLGGRNDQGVGVAWRANGYSPLRISTHAMELAWQSYPTIADARGFSYQDQGHKFWVINFPSGNATWVYDVATQLWHQRSFYNVTAGTQDMALPQNHTFNFGKHLVGDRKSGTIYQMSIPTQANGGGWNFATDNGALIRRVRRAPHISTEQQWLRYATLQVDLETGIGPQPPLRDGAGEPRGPIATLRYSKDGGHTWSQGRDKDCGQAGNYRTRAIWRRLGRARDMVFELSVSDPIPWRIVDSYLMAAPGFAPSERIVKDYAKSA
jgi:hypothetical protein